MFDMLHGAQMLFGNCMAFNSFSYILMRMVSSHVIKVCFAIEPGMDGSAGMIQPPERTRHRTAPIIFQILTPPVRTGENVFLQHLVLIL